MMGLLSGVHGAVTGSSAKRRASMGDPIGPAERGGDDETSILDEEQGNIIMHLISQLRIGMDLHKVTFPTFVLEPRSMLERVTDFMSHPELIFGAGAEPDPEERFIRVLSYYLSGWHVKPKGVKKPYNPVLGEFFRCRYDYQNGTQGFYIAEQVSHHPPISAYFYISPANKIRIAGELRPKSKFLGNSVSTILEGENRIFLMDKPKDGEYVISMPNMYARGILFGTMILELGDMSIARAAGTGMTCDVEFKTKGFFSGIYNTVAGRVKRDNVEIGNIEGRWSHQMEFKSSKNGEKRTLFDAVTENNVVAKTVLPESEQEANESRRLWSKLTDAIAKKDMEAATAAKSEVEDMQRDLARQREEKGVKHVPKYFELRNGLWQAKINLPEDPDDMITAAQQWIWPSSQSGSAAPA